MRWAVRGAVRWRVLNNRVRWKGSVLGKGEGPDGDGTDLPRANKLVGTAVHRSGRMDRLENTIYPSREASGRKMLRTQAIDALIKTTS